MLRRLTITAVASLAALSAAAPAATASPLTLPLPPLPVLQGIHGLQGVWHDEPGQQTRLTVTVSDSGNPAADGTFELKCGPAGGTHPTAQRACDRLTEAAESGNNPFVPTAQDAMCTQQAGGPAAARIQGTWQGQELDARFSRANGCEISRWNNLVPVLPSAR